MATILTVGFVGFMLGLIVAALFKRSNANTSMELSAQAKTARKINGRFYYIVPEDVYVEKILIPPMRHNS